jgi:hypothetical protein
MQAERSCINIDHDHYSLSHVIMLCRFTELKVAAVKLVNLFQLFTSPRFLYAAEGNHAYVALLLETFNNVVQYQYEGKLFLQNPAFGYLVLQPVSYFKSHNV